MQPSAAGDWGKSRQLALGRVGTRQLAGADGRIAWLRSPCASPPNEFYYRGCTPEDANGWHVSIYAFPASVTPPVRFQNGSALLDVALEPLNLPLVSIVQLKVLYLPKEKVFMGVFVNHVKFNAEPKSGWMLYGPWDFSRTKKGTPRFGDLSSGWNSRLRTSGTRSDTPRSANKGDQASGVATASDFPCLPASARKPISSCNKSAGYPWFPTRGVGDNAPLAEA